MGRKKKPENLIKERERAARMTPTGELAIEKPRRQKNPPAPMFEAGVDKDARAAKIRAAFQFISKVLTNEDLVLVFLTSVARRVIAGTMLRQDASVLNGIANTCLNAMKQKGVQQGIGGILVSFGKRKKDGTQDVKKIEVTGATEEQVESILDKLSPGDEPTVIIDVPVHKGPVVDDTKPESEDDADIDTGAKGHEGPLGDSP